jgi:hypothetical protein
MINPKIPNFLKFFIYLKNKFGNYRVYHSKFNELIFRVVEAGLNSRIITKKPRWSENDKRRRVEIAEENLEFDIDI